MSSPPSPATSPWGLGGFSWVIVCPHSHPFTRLSKSWPTSLQGPVPHLCKTWHFSWLNFIRFLLCHSCRLSQSYGWQPYTSTYCLIPSSWCHLKTWWEHTPPLVKPLDRTGSRIDMQIPHSLQASRSKQETWPSEPHHLIRLYPPHPDHISPNLVQKNMGACVKSLAKIPASIHCSSLGHKSSQYTTVSQKSLFGINIICLERHFMYKLEWGKWRWKNLMHKTQFIYISLVFGNDCGRTVPQPNPRELGTFPVHLNVHCQTPDSSPEH